MTIMGAFFIIECSCGNSTTVWKPGLLRRPSGQVVCEGLTKTGSCGRIYQNDELIRIIERGVNVYKAQESEQLKLGTNNQPLPRGVK